MYTKFYQNRQGFVEDMTNILVFFWFIVYIYTLLASELVYMKSA